MEQHVEETIRDSAGTPAYGDDDMITKPSSKGMVDKIDFQKPKEVDI